MYSADPESRSDKVWTNVTHPIFYLNFLLKEMNLPQLPLYLIIISFESQGDCLKLHNKTFKTPSLEHCATVTVVLNENKY